jgi:hypothetical protein
MIEALIVALIAVILAYLSGREKKHSYLLLTAFAILTTFLSLGYYWGNDVAMYEKWFEGFENSGISWWNFSQYDSFAQKEYGFVCINLLLKPFGFWGMRAILFIVENAIVYWFIKSHVNKKWHWLAVFIYVFNPNFWVLSSSMMRQWLAMCVILLSIMCLEKGKIFRYLLLVLLAFSIHFSAVVGLVFLPLSFLQKKNSMRSFVILIACLIVFWVLSPFFIDYVVLFLKAEDFYLTYMDTHGGIGITSIVFFIINTFILYSSVKTKQHNNLACWIVVLHALVMPLLTYGELISRIGLYFTIFSMVSFPLFMDNPRIDKAIKSTLMSVVVMYYIYAFFFFFNSPTWVRAYGTYQTVIGRL